jgi:hypothetical protein
MDLLERDDFLAMLRDCPPGHVILLAGEAGIGKTSRDDAHLRTASHGEAPAQTWGTAPDAGEPPPAEEWSRVTR